MSSLFRDDLDAIPAYIPGRSIPGAIKISSNEVTDAPDQSIIDAVATAVAGGNRYPDTSSKELRTAIAAALTQDLCARASLDNASDNASSGEGDDNAVTGATETTEITPEQIVVGNGSVSLLQHLVQAACPAGSNLVMPWRSFEAYPIFAQVVGAYPIPVPLGADQRVDLPAMAQKITDKTKLIFVCNPNNPSGTTITKAEFAAFMDAVPADVLVALDEAYIEYNRATDTPLGTELVGTYPNLVCLRTFSKAYGLAGVRIGYAFGPENIIEALNKVAIPFSASTVAQVGARAALAASVAWAKSRIIGGEALGRRLAESSAQGKILDEVCEAFGLEGRPERIEIYDNAHIQGTNAVGGMVVAGPEGFVKGQEGAAHRAGLVDVALVGAAQAPP